MEWQGRIFNIERHGLVDGPGIRTVVFFKGCPLHCRWCHNPESQMIRDEIMYSAESCAGCGTCAALCPQRAISTDTTTRQRRYHLDKCVLCGTCVRGCPSGALEMAGRDTDVDTLIDEIVRASVFYRRSGGGVTLSGGEPLLQPEFCSALLTECRKEGIHTAVDTCGHVAWETIERILDRVDLFLYDIKHVDDRKHRYGTGDSNRLILENLRKLSARRRDGYPEITVRIPIIPHFNATIEEMGDIFRFLKQENIQRVELLPFHHYGQSKFRKLGKRYTFEGCPLLESGFKEKCAALARSEGFEVILGE